MWITSIELKSENMRAEHYLKVFARRLTPEQNQEIRTRLATGESGSAIASSMGLPRYRIYAFVYHQRKSRQQPLPQSRPQEKYNMAYELWIEGKPIREIAAAYGYTLKRMCGVIEHYRKQFGWFANRFHRKKT